MKQQRRQRKTRQDAGRFSRSVLLQSQLHVAVVLSDLVWAGQRHACDCGFQDQKVVCRCGIVDECSGSCWLQSIVRFGRAFVCFRPVLADLQIEWQNGNMPLPGFAYGISDMGSLFLPSAHRGERL